MWFHELRYGYVRQQDNGFARQLVNETTSGAVAGGLRRNYGLTELRIRRVSSKLMAQSLSLLSLPFQLRSVSEASAAATCSLVVSWTRSPKKGLRSTR